MNTLLHQLYSFGQSPWLDYISRRVIKNGHLLKMIEKGIVGVTSNPTIFDKAIQSGDDYDPIIKELTEKGKNNEEIYDYITINDIRDTCDIFLPVYKQTGKKDGYVSLEVNPHLAYDTDRTVWEAEKLFQIVSRPNLMIKVPATDEGFSAVETLLSQGINVNVTLIFSREQYIKTANAYLDGIEKAFFKRIDLNNLASVASVFVSRIDASVDKMLDKKITDSADKKAKDELSRLKGEAAISNARMIYQEFTSTFSQNRYQKLAEKGANVQRVLWASTSTKDPNYSDIKYVQELIAKNTVNTMPKDTIEAFLDHGKVEKGISEESSEEQKVISLLGNYEISIEQVCQKLLTEGVQKFIDSFESLLSSIEEKRKIFKSD